MIRSIIVAAALAIVSFAFTSESSARSRHEQVEIKPIQRKGEVVGIRVKMTLRPDDYGHSRVRIGVGPKGGSKSQDYRDQASGKKKFLLHSLGEFKDLKHRQPRTETFEVLYKDAPNLTPGSEIEIVSAWSDSKGGYWHVWGMSNALAKNATTYKLPGSPTKATTAAANARTGKAPGKAAGKATGKAPGKAAGKATGKAAGKATGKAAGKVTGKAAGKATATGRLPRTAGKGTNAAGRLPRAAALVRVPGSSARASTASSRARAARPKAPRAR